MRVNVNIYIILLLVIFLHKAVACWAEDRTPQGIAAMVISQDLKKSNYSHKTAALMDLTLSRYLEKGVDKTRFYIFNWQEYFSGSLPKSCHLRIKNGKKSLQEGISLLNKNNFQPAKNKLYKAKFYFRNSFYFLTSLDIYRDTVLHLARAEYLLGNVNQSGYFLANSLNLDPSMETFPGPKIDNNFADLFQQARLSRLGKKRISWQIKCNQTNVQIYLNTKFVGLCPQKLESVPLGIHFISAYKTGFKKWGRAQELKDNLNPNTISVDLQKGSRYQSFQEIANLGDKNDRLFILNKLRQLASKLDVKLLMLFYLSENLNRGKIKSIIYRLDKTEIFIQANKNYYFGQKNKKPEESFSHIAAAIETHLPDLLDIDYLPILSSTINAKYNPPSIVLKRLPEQELFSDKEEKDIEKEIEIEDLPVITLDELLKKPGNLLPDSKVDKIKTVDIIKATPETLQTEQNKEKTKEKSKRPKEAGKKIKMDLEDDLVEGKKIIQGSMDE